jgi:hypothetical protein
MGTEERVARLEESLAEYDALVARLKALARLTPAGRALLRAAGQ